MAPGLLDRLGTTMAPTSPRWLGSLAVAATMLHFWGRNLADPDLWGHLTWGRMMIRDRALPRTDTFSYTAAGRPFFDHEWLADVLTAGVFDAAGSWGLIGVKVGLGIVMLACMLDAVRTLARAALPDRRPHPFTVAAVTVLAMAVIAPGATFRPQLFTMAFTAAAWALLSRADERRHGTWHLACLPALVALWANLHGGFLVGVGLCGLYAASVAWRAVRGHAGAPGLAGVVAAGTIALAVAAAPLLNPYGADLYRYLAGTLHQHDGIVEWDAVALLDLSFLRFKMMLVATAVVGAWWWRTERAPEVRGRLAWQLAFVALAAWWAIRHQRHTVLFAIAATPVLIVGAERLRARLLVAWPALRPQPRVMTAVAAGVLAIAVVQIGGVAAALVRHGGDIRYSRLAYPMDALAFIRTHDLRGNLALPMQWGSYTVHHLGDRVRVFIDGRFEAVYPRRVVEDYFAFVRGEPGWQRLLDAYPTDIVLLRRAHGAHARMFARDDFVYVYSDRTALVFVRRDGPNDAALDRLTRTARRPALPAAEPVFP